MLKRTAIALGSIAIALWIATSWLASDERFHERTEPIRAVVQGLAITAAVLAGIILALRAIVPEIVNRVCQARLTAYVARPAYLPPTVEQLSAQVTMELPKPKVAVTVGAPSTGGRTQAYWDALADMSETLLGPRDDDPEPMA